MIEGANVQAVSANDTTYLTKYGYVYNNTTASIAINILPVSRANSNTPGDGTIVNLPAGGIFPVLVKKVFLTSTGVGSILLITQS